MRSAHAWLPPHSTPTYTGANQVGIAFSGHTRLPWSSGSRVTEADIAPGSAIVTGAAGIEWLRVREPTEALEIYPALPVADLEPVVGAADGVVLGIGSVLRRVHATDAYLSDVAASGLAHRLTAHLLGRYHGQPVERGPGTLDPRAVDRVAEYVDSALAESLTLDRLAAVAALSPYHFARAFRTATGLPPHAYVTSRRMDRARLLLRAGALPVAEVAGAVGFSNVGHFRRVFHRHTGVAPGRLRQDSKNRPGG